MNYRSVPPETLPKMLDYDPASGKLFWKYRDAAEFPQAQLRAWNSRWSGKEAFTGKSKGYFTGAILGHKCSAHRVIWALHYGYWPNQDIDHINHDRADNRISNLRLVSNGENSRNQSSYCTNTSGYNGVSWNKRKQKWCASIDVRRKHIYLGYFEKIDDAVSARQAANAKFGFHQNHGSAAT